MSLPAYQQFLQLRRERLSAEALELSEWLDRHGSACPAVVLEAIYVRLGELRHEVDLLWRELNQRA